MKIGALIKFVPTDLHRKREQIRREGGVPEFKLYETISGHRNFGNFKWIPMTEIGLVLKTVEYESIATERARILFPTGIGWLDARDLQEITPWLKAYL